MPNLTADELLIFSLKKGIETPFGTMYESRLVPPNEVWLLDSRGKLHKIINIGISLEGDLGA